MTITAYDAMLFQSTLPVRGATSAVSCIPRRTFCISIHAPRAGSDPSALLSAFEFRNFNPRSPCGERQGDRYAYQSRADFNPRSPCGERRQNT